MPVERLKLFPEGTADSVAVFALLSWKGRLNLEKLGVRASGGPTRPKIAARLGLKPRDSFNKFIAKVEEQLEAYKTSV